MRKVGGGVSEGRGRLVRKVGEVVRVVGEGGW